MKNKLINIIFIYIFILSLITNVYAENFNQIGNNIQNPLINNTQNPLFQNNNLNNENIQNSNIQDKKASIETKLKKLKEKYKQQNTEIENENVQEEEIQNINRNKVNQFSFIELGFFDRTKNLNIRLTQFGYDFFYKKSKPSINIPNIDTYRVGPGDEIILYPIGVSKEFSGSFSLKVDREGNIYIPDVGVFYVWGLTLKEIEELISDSLGINVKLSLGRLRTFNVYIAGEVYNPGVVTLYKTNTILDALSLAGGVKKTGSLRNIIITKKSGRRIKVDLYKLLIYGKPLNIRLDDGDVILVEPIGKTIGIGGKVKRPAIYEITGKERIRDLIKLAGGLLPSSYEYKVILQRYEKHKYLKIIEGSLSDESFMNMKAKDGDLIIIKSVINAPINAIEIKGYTTYPGIYEYKPNMRLSEILTKDMFFKDTNTKFAIIKRFKNVGEPPIYISFSPEEIILGEKDVYLYPGDTIILYKFGDIKSVDFDKVKDAFVVEGEIKYPGVYAYKENTRISDILNYKTIKMNTNLDYAEIERRNPYTLDTEKIEIFSPRNVLNGKIDFKIKRLDIIRFFPKYIYAPIKVSGLVKKPYKIPYMEGITLLQALSKAEYQDDIQNLKVEIFRAPKNVSKGNIEENIKVEAKTGKEISKSKALTIYLYDLLVNENKNLDVKLFPGDRIIVKRILPSEVVKKVYIFGYVKRPGVYSLRKNKTLYDLLKSAGGFRENAYPKGIVFLRKSVAEMQRKKLNIAVNLMRQYLLKEEAGVMQSDLKGEELKAREKAFEAKQRLLDELTKTQVTGRISGLEIPRNLEALKNSPFNLKLETGDRIYVPSIPANVLVFGEVYNPSAYVYRKGMKVKDYLALSGGFTKFADKENIFVIKANGTTLSSESLDNKFITWDGSKKRFVWGGAYNEILNYELEPGDAVIVPTEIHVPVMWRPLIKDVLQILYQSLLSAYMIKNL